MRHILRAAGELISCRVLQRSCQHLVGQFFFVFFRVVHAQAKTGSVTYHRAAHARSGVLACALTLGLALRFQLQRH